MVQHSRVLTPRAQRVQVRLYLDASVQLLGNRATSIANEVGIKIKQVPEEYGMPGVGLTGGYYVAGGGDINEGGYDNLLQFSDTLSWVRGGHNLKFGADIRVIRFDERLGLNNNGMSTFDGRYTGNAVGDFLLGNPSAMNAQIGLGQGRWRSKSLNFFVGDDWKITPRLTLNLGLRYEYDQPMYERDRREGYSTLRWGNSWSGSLEARPSSGNTQACFISPTCRRASGFRTATTGRRIGFAYRIGDSMALRGGYGVFYSKTQGNEMQFKINAPPLVFAAALTGNLNAPNLLWDRDAFPDPALPTFGRHAFALQRGSTRPDAVSAAVEPEPGAVVRRAAARSRLRRQ